MTGGERLWWWAVDVANALANVVEALLGNRMFGATLRTRLRVTLSDLWRSLCNAP